MKKTGRNHDVHVIGRKQRQVVVHIDNGTMTLDQAARLAVDIATVVAEEQPKAKDSGTHARD